MRIDWTTSCVDVKVNQILIKAVCIYLVLQVSVYFVRSTENNVEISEVV